MARGPARESRRAERRGPGAGVRRVGRGAPRMRHGADLRWRCCLLVGGCCLLADVRVTNTKFNQIYLKFQDLKNTRRARTPAAYKSPTMCNSPRPRGTRRLWPLCCPAVMRVSSLSSALPALSPSGPKLSRRASWTMSSRPKPPAPERWWWASSAVGHPSVSPPRLVIAHTTRV